MKTQPTQVSASPFFPAEHEIRQKPKHKTAAKVLVDLLKQAGVKQIFGVGGDALNAFTDALRTDGEIKWRGFRHEENAAYAAYAQSEITGGLGVCAGTVGPGALHLINGLYNAKREGGAVLAITGQVPTHERGTGYFQEVNLAKIFDDVCDFQAIVTSANQFLRLAELAIQKALTERCVVRLEVPIDLMNAEIPSLELYHPLIAQKISFTPPPEKIAHALELMQKAGKTSILAGIGCRNAVPEVLALSRALNAPIAHTLRAKDVFEGTHENVVGLTGLIGLPPGYHAVLDCDLLIMLGTNFPYEDFLPKDKMIIQIDSDIESIGRRAGISLGLYGTVKETLELILAHKPTGKTSQAFLHHLKEMHAHNIELLNQQSSMAREDEPLHPAVLARAVSQVASQDAIFGVDVGESTVWVARYMSMHGGRRMLGSFNHGSMGGALPIALGAQASAFGREVWAFCGDGGFAMSMQDLVTAVRFKWPVKVVVFNNSELGFVKMENEVSGFALDPDATELVNPNFALYAEACGATGIRVERASEISAALEKAMRTPGPVLLDVIVTSGELTLPPHIEAKQAWGFGISKIKEGLLGFKGDHKQWASWKKEFDANLKHTGKLQ